MNTNHSASFSQFGRLSYDDIDYRLARAEHFLSLRYIPDGERDEAISSWNLYLWIKYGLRYGDEEQRKTILIQWLEDRRGYTRQTDYQHEIEGPAHRAAYWQSPLGPRIGVSEETIERYVETRCTPKAFELANKKRESCAFRKIVDAFHELLRHGIKVTERAISRLTGCSRRIVAKYRKLWSGPRGITPEYEPVALEISSEKALLDLKEKEEEKEKKESTESVLSAEIPSGPCTPPPRRNWLTLSRGSQAGKIKHMTPDHRFHEAAFTKCIRWISEGVTRYGALVRAP